MNVLRPLATGVATLTVALASSLGVAAPSQAAGVIRIGAIYPLSGSQASGGREEYHGMQVAARMVNQLGGIQGKRITFVTTDAPSADAAGQRGVTTRQTHLLGERRRRHHDY